ncbi:sigma-70 family RNA polymerase sigma factor [Pedobacter miscanthi]|uniref:RNA polymerase sigma factor n=1 Tax=Pedobacter miscanthi TaxID=2259170 RepID=UPI00292EB6E2|nr:sigma-70 family RNA polymerase sigma factor [Pedobacter miscanthi]
MEEELLLFIKKCQNNDRKSQQYIYKNFYSYALGICQRYTKNREEAVAVLNLGFLKIFTNINRFDHTRSFRTWLRRIMINVSIDNYRANINSVYFLELDQVNDIYEVNQCESNLNYSDLLEMVRKLPRAYQAVFNLFAIDGYSHEEVAECLNISVGTSKSNLHKARKKLKDMINGADK